MSAPVSVHDHTTSDDLLKVKNLKVTFERRKTRTFAVNDISFSLKAGRVLCIIGESGSGKSVMLNALMRLLPPKQADLKGNILFRGKDLTTLDERSMSLVRGSEIAMVFQEPMTALDPVYTIGQQIAEAIRRHGNVSREDARREALRILELVRIPSAERRLDSYPHQLSGGLRQRAMIAVALACRPSLLLADEPTTALDATVQIQVLLLLKSLQQESGMGMIFVTHDLGVAAQIADDVAVMYAGQIVEYGSAEKVLLNPRHPYTLAMLSSTARGQNPDEDIPAIPGNPPDLRNLPAGCSFAPRCGLADGACKVTAPELAIVPGGGQARCLKLDLVANDKLTTENPAAVVRRQPSGYGMQR